MKEERIMIGMVLLVIASMILSVNAQPPIPPGEEGIYYLIPRHSNASYCNEVVIEVWVNATNMTAHGGVRGGTATIEVSDKSCANITGGAYNSTFWDLYGAATILEGGKKIVLGYGTYYPGKPPGVYNIGYIVVHCNSSTCCVADLNFVPDTLITGADYADCDVPGQNGTFTCIAPQETFSKSLVKGWNLISLPLTADDMTVSSVFSSIAGKYDAIYRYDAETKHWVALDRNDTLENGVGYFIHMTEDATWTYNGSAFTSMSIQLEKGLNMIGWLNCSMPINQTDLGNATKVRYIARWNATSHRFEVYVPGAPDVFNDFDTLERGVGYFVAVKEPFTLTESC